MTELRDITQLSKLETRFLRLTPKRLQVYPGAENWPLCGGTFTAAYQETLQEAFNLFLRKEKVRLMSSLFL